MHTIFIECLLSHVKFPSLSPFVIPTELFRNKTFKASEHLLELVFKIVGHHIFPIADYKMQERNRHEDVLRFRLFEDNLSQDKAGDIFLGLGIDNLYVVSLANNIQHVTQGNIFAVGRIVETPVGVFLKKDGFCHDCMLPVQVEGSKGHHTARTQ